MADVKLGTKNIRKILLTFSRLQSLCPVNSFIIITPKLNISDLNDISPLSMRSCAMYPLWKK